MKRNTQPNARWFVRLSQALVAVLVIAALPAPGVRAESLFQEPDPDILITQTPPGGSTTEPGGTVTLAIRLSEMPSGVVTLGFSSSDPGEGTVPTGTTLSFNSLNWDLAQNVLVTGENDEVADGDQSYTITASVTVSEDPVYPVGMSRNISLLNADDDTAGVTVAPTSGLQTTENGGTAEFTVRLTSQPTADVTINLASSDATEGAVAPASLAFTPGNWSGTRTVTVTGQEDQIEDGNVSYQINTTATSSDGTYNDIPVADVSLTNVDDDPAGFQVTPPPGGLTTSESGAQASFTVRLLSPPSASVTIAVGSGDPGEGSASPASLTFSTANWDEPQTVTVTGVDDDVDDGNISYSIVLGAAASSDPDYDGENPVDVNATNNDNDAAGFVVSRSSGLVTTEAPGEPGPNTFTVVLSSQPTADVSIPVSSNNPSEGTASPTSLTFTPGNWNSAQTVTVIGEDDDLADGNTSYTIILGAAQSTDQTYDDMNPDDVGAVNQDDENAGVLVTGSPNLQTVEGGTPAAFTIRLSHAPTSPVTIALDGSEDSEATVNPSTVTFNATDWDEPRTVSVTAVDDTQVDGEQPFQVLFTVTGPAPYAGMAVPPLAVTIVDDDPAGIAIDPNAGLVTRESGPGNSDSFSIALTKRPSASVIISLESSDTTEGTIDRAVLTFTTSNWNVPQEVTVTGQDDDEVDGTVSYFVHVNSVTSLDNDYSVLDPNDIPVTNQDNDRAEILVDPAAGLVTSETGGTDAFQVSLSSRPKGEVILEITSDTPAEGGAIPVLLTFTRDNWAVQQTVTVTGEDDPDPDGDRPYIIEVKVKSTSDPGDPYKNADPVEISVTNRDNDPPSPFDDEYSTGEDTALNIPAPGVLANDKQGSGTLSASLVDDVQYGTLVLNANGSFTYTPNPDFNGIDGFSYKVEGQSAAENPYVKLTVDPVNDAPEAVDDIYYSNALKFKIEPGGVLENDLDIDGDDLSATLHPPTSSSLVTLAPDGSFTFTAPGANTVSTFSYVARDPGGAASQPAQATVIIENDPPSLTWQGPVTDGKTFVVPAGTREPIVLQVTAADDALDPVIDMDYVYFNLYHAQDGYRFLGTVYKSPGSSTFTLELDASQLKPDFYQVVVVAVDQAGNSNIEEFLDHIITIEVSSYRVLMPVLVR